MHKHTRQSQRVKAISDYHKSDVSSNEKDGTHKQYELYFIHT